MFNNIATIPAVNFAVPIIIAAPDQVASYADRFQYANDDAGMIMSIITYCFAEIAHEVAPGRVQDPDTANCVYQPNVTIRDSTNNGMLNPQALALVNAGRQFFPSRLRVAAPLLACHYVRPLTAKNIQGFLLESKLPKYDFSPLIPALDAYSRIAGDLLTDAALNNFVQSTTWGRYHSALGSTGSLIQRVMNDLGTLAAAIFTPAEIAAVGASNAARRNLALAQAIPRRAVLITAVYLEVNNILPDGWVTGTREIENAAGTQLAQCRAFFKALKRISSNADATIAAMTLGELAANAPGFLIGDVANMRAIV